MPEQKTCSEDGCDNVAVGRGLCNKHWKRWRKANPDEPLLKHSRHVPYCTEEGCGKPYHARGLCRTHYARLYRKALISTEMRKRKNARARRWNKANPEKLSDIQQRSYQKRKRRKFAERLAR